MPTTEIQQNDSGRCREIRGCEVISVSIAVSLPGPGAIRTRQFYRLELRTRCYLK